MSCCSEVGSSFIYLVRFAESGRDAQPERQGARRDLAGVLADALPEARIETASGRLIVESERDAEAVLADLPGIASFSPCRRVAASGSTLTSSWRGPDAPSVPTRGAVPFDRESPSASAMTGASRWLWRTVPGPAVCSAST